MDFSNPNKSRGTVVLRESLTKHLENDSRLFIMSYANDTVIFKHAMVLAAILILQKRPKDEFECCYKLMNFG